MELTPLTLCLIDEPAPNAPRTTTSQHYIHEILQHAGLCYETVTVAELPAALASRNRRLLLTVGDNPAIQIADEITRWVEGGGSWIAVAGICGAGECLGVKALDPTFVGWSRGARSLGEGYMVAKDTHRIIAGNAPMHFFGGLAVEVVKGNTIATAEDHHQRETTGAALVENSRGSGRTLLIAPDLVGTVVRIQQGRTVTIDGVSAADGTGPTTDGVLKSDDGLVLDWIFDRCAIPGVDGLNGFTRAIADEWRELLLRSIFYLAEESGTSIPLLWYYPGNLPGLAHLSHDSDINEPEKAASLRRVLGEAEINSTWCIIAPGYPEDEIEAISAAGHELAFHYDAMSTGRTWSRTEFMEQYAEVSALCGRPLLTNKDHYLRWEGDTDVLEWCRDAGIQLDQTKGTSKTGEVGYPFGTCHLHFLLDRAGKPIDVLELATPTQDLLVFAPEAAVDPLIETAARHYGVLHVLFHPAHIEKPGVADALKNTVAKAKARGMEWWTGARLSAWERSRRTVTWDCADGFAVTSQAKLDGATLMWLAGKETRPGAQQVERWGYKFEVMITDLEPGKRCQLQ